MTETTLDVRTIPPYERHTQVFATFQALSVGDTMILLADHEPAPLQHQFSTINTGLFAWAYLERGPLVWRVSITKTGERHRDEGASCCGTCG